METLDIVVRSGTVVNAGGAFTADVGISGGIIAQVGGSMRGRREISAEGRLVLPGGVDPHVHLSPARPAEPGAFRWADDFYSGSKAAIAGGVTSIGNMTFQWEGESLEAALERDLTSARSDAAIDFFLHPVLTTPGPAARASLLHLTELGVGTVKVFMTNPAFDSRIDDFLSDIRAAAELGYVVLMHCEDGALLRSVAQDMERCGRVAVAEWASSRPDFVEESAIRRAIAIAQTTGAPIYAVHVSSAVALEACREAKRKGVPFSVETRPMYLHLTREQLESPDGAKFVGAPPLREGSDSAALWTALRDGTVDTVATDHAPWSLAAKLDTTLDVRTARQGVADLETSLPLLFTEGVQKGRLSLERFVEVVSARPAQLFGLWPQKGMIAPGSDADVVVWDPQHNYVIRAAEMYTHADYSVYEGREVTGAPMTTIAGGRVVMWEREVRVDRGRGKWLSTRPRSLAPDSPSGHAPAPGGRGSAQRQGEERHG